MTNFNAWVALTTAASVLSACAAEPSQVEQSPVENGSVATMVEPLLAANIDEFVASVSNLTVRVPKRFNVPYTGAAAAEFPNGLPLSIGSGLRRIHGGPWLTFVGLTDRGPNGDAPDYLDATGTTHSTKAFLTAAFNPELVTIEVLPFFGPTVTSTTRLRLDHAPVNGIPLSNFSPEVALTEQLTAIPASPVGFDTEGIDFDAWGNAWLCDEYGPSLLKVNPRSGEILQLLRPGAGLPTILASRQASRGFEGVAVSPNGKIYGLIQSTLDIRGSTKGKAQFIRMVEYDPRRGTTRMFAYPHDLSEYAKSGDAKLGDLIAVDNEHFL
ncbi:MAG TPA: esterase-like activity of phytase family protein, partial [Polyangiaceae bacterium]